MIVMPKTKFDKFVSSAFEKCLPTIMYFTWREVVNDARKNGMTIQDKLYCHFFKQKNIYFHAYAQQ